MGFDLENYYNDNKKFYGENTPLEHVAKDAYQRGFHKQYPDYDSFKQATGIDKIIQADTEKRRPPTFEEKLRDMVSKITPAGYEDVSTNLVSGATMGYIPANKTPEGSSFGRQAAARTANLFGMYAPLAAIETFSRMIPYVGEAEMALSGITGGVYGALRKPEEGESRITNAAKDAAIFGFFGIANSMLGRGLSKAIPAVGKVFEKAAAGGELTAGENIIKHAADYGKAAILGGGYSGIAEQADTPEQRLQNVLMGATAFAGAHGLSHAVRLVTGGQKLDAEAEDYIKKAQLAVHVHGIIGEGLTTGEYDGKPFTPDHAIDLIQEGLHRGVFDDGELDRFKERYPQIKDGINDLITSRLIGKVDESLPKTGGTENVENKRAAVTKGADAEWDGYVSKAYEEHSGRVEAERRSLLGSTDTAPGLRAHIESGDPNQGIIHNEDLYYHPEFKELHEFAKDRGLNAVPVVDTSGSFNAYVRGKDVFVNMDDKGDVDYKTAIAHETSHNKGNENTQSKINPESSAFKKYMDVLNKPFKEIKQKPYTVEKALQEYAADLESGTEKRYGITLGEGLREDVSRETIPNYGEPLKDLGKFFKPGETEQKEGLEAAAQKEGLGRLKGLSPYPEGEEAKGNPPWNRTKEEIMKEGEPSPEKLAETHGLPYFSTRGKEADDLQNQIKKQGDYLASREDAKGKDGYIRLAAKIEADKKRLAELKKPVEPTPKDKDFLAEEARNFKSVDEWTQSVLKKSRPAGEVKENEYVKFTPPETFREGGVLRPWYGSERVNQYNDGAVIGRVVKINPKSITIKAENPGEWNDGRTYKIPKDAKASIDLSPYVGRAKEQLADIWKQAQEAKGSVSGKEEKEAIPITRDDKGNVIPLSERFNQKKTDIRFQGRDKDLESEARKYKTAEDFVKAQLAKQVESVNIDSMIPKKGTADIPVKENPVAEADLITNKYNDNKPKAFYHSSFNDFDNIRADISDRGGIYLLDEEMFPIDEFKENLKNKKHLTAKEIDEKRRDYEEEFDEDGFGIYSNLSRFYGDKVYPFAISKDAKLLDLTQDKNIKFFEKNSPEIRKMAEEINGDSEDAVTDILSHFYDTPAERLIHKEAKRLGFDGVIIEDSSEGMPHKSYVIYDPKFLTHYADLPNPSRPPEVGGQSAKDLTSIWNKVQEEAGESLKEPWQMTREEFAANQGKDSPYVQQQRDAIVKKAIKEGKPVPESVLKDYPDLQKAPKEEPFDEEEWKKHDRRRTQIAIEGMLRDRRKAQGSGNFQTRDKEPKDAFYSQLSRVVESKLPNSGTPEQFKDMINAWASKGEFKADELRWSGLDDYLKEKQGKISKREVVDYLKQNQVQIEEITKGEPSENGIDTFLGDEAGEGFTRDEAREYLKNDEGATKFSSYQLPGGENYKELLLTLPEKSKFKNSSVLRIEFEKKYGRNFISELTTAEKKKWEDSFDLDKKAGESNYASQHWDEPNVLAHVRMNDRVGQVVGDKEFLAKGAFNKKYDDLSFAEKKVVDERVRPEKILFLEEVQSDWHQEGRKKGYETPRKPESIKVEKLDDGTFGVIVDGQAMYQGNTREGADRALERIRNNPKVLTGVPEAPFSKTWHELAMKRMLRYAAENGYDKLAWTTGEQQAERYDLSKQVGDFYYWFNDPSGKIDFNPEKDEIGLSIYTKDGQSIKEQEIIKQSELEGLVGKDVAKRILEGERNSAPKELGKGVYQLEADDLKVGGEGMKGFYDQIIPSFLNKYAKKWGAKVGETDIRKTEISDAELSELNKLANMKRTPEQQARYMELGQINDGTVPGKLLVHSVPITGPMKESVMQGQPMFMPRDNKLSNQEPSAISKKFDDIKDRIGAATDKIAAVKSAKEGLTLAYDGLQRTFYPAARTEDSKKAAETIITQMGTNWRQEEVFKNKLNEITKQYSDSTTLAAKAFDAMKTSTGVLADATFNQMPKRQQWDFIGRIQSGARQTKDGKPSPELQAIADTLSKMFDDLYHDAETVTPGAVKYRTGYFPGMWEDEEAAQKFFADRAKSLEGSKAFTKEKVFDNIWQGIAAGLKPKGTPLDMAFAKMHEVQKYVTTHRVLKEMEADQTAILVRSGEKAPAGYVLIPEPYGVLTKVDGKSFRYAAKDDVAQVFTNYLSPSLYESKYVGKLYEAYMNAANTLNQFQLGVGAAFHAGFTSMDAVISHFALGVKAMARGDVPGAVKMMLESPLQVVKNPMIGDKLLKAYRGESVTGQEIPQMVKWLEMAGARVAMDNRLRTSSTDKLIQDWTEGNKASALLRSPFALVEQMARPILEWLVPRQKFGVFAEMSTEWSKQNPEASHEDTRTAMQYIWNRIDSRLGQVVYERLFTKQIAKNIVQGVIRAPGWTGGTIVEIGGGVKDFANVFRDMAAGKKPQMTDKMAYTISLLTVTGIINGVMTALLTGEGPKDGKDLLAFRTGKTDEHGNPERMLLPTYAKDIYAYLNKPGTTLLNKTHPIISLMNDMAKNKDYYGVQIRDKEANPLTQAGQEGLYAAKAFVPFWMRGEQKAKERGDNLATELSPLIGIMPATSEFTKTKAQELMTDILADRSKATLTKSQFETNKLKQKLETRLRNHDESANQEIQDYLKAGKLSRKDVVSIQRAVRTPYEIHAFQSLSFNEAIHVFSVATPKEKKMFEPLLRKKLHLVQNLAPAERQAAIEKYKEAING